MSPAAIERRLHDLASLYRLGRSLATARILGPAEAAPGPAMPEAAPQAQGPAGAAPGESDRAEPQE